MQRIEENLRTVEKLFRDLATGDLDAMMNDFDDAAVWDYPQGTPISGKHAGKPAIRKLFGMLRDTYSGGIEIQRLTLRAADDCVFAEYGWIGSRPDGTKHRDHFLTLFQISFGKITAVRQFAMGVAR
ncbi:MAG: nuclear transport factor 2 family protein [Deltaproteobacteria bacterium]|nr:nuclear transport factor 2 family protein [Deltaproteobacteria bacterium]